jgi:hypothetical protein
MLDGIFGGNFNPHKKRNLEMECLPDNSDRDFLFEVSNFKNKKLVTEKVLERINEIEDGIQQILDFNSELEKDEINQIKLDAWILDELWKAKNNIGVLTHGGVTSWNKEKLKDLLEHSPITPHGYSWENEYMCYYPEDYGRKLDPKGNWIMVIDTPNCVSAPSLYQIYYATPNPKPCQSYGGTYKRWMANIICNNSEVLLYPYEYIVIKDGNWLLENIGKGIKMIEGSQSARLDKNKVFYLKSRGFNQAEIYQILFKSVTNKGFCHFEVEENFANMFYNIQKGMSVELAVRVQDHIDNLPTFKFGEIC